MIEHETKYTCDKCKTLIIGTVYLGDGGHYHQECVPLPAHVQAEDAAIKAKPKWRVMTAEDVTRIMPPPTPLPGFAEVHADAVRRRLAALDYDQVNEAEAAHGDPPYPHELVARMREMAEDAAKWETYTEDSPDIFRKWKSRDCLPKDGNLGSFLSAAPYLLAILEPPAGKAGKDTKE